MVNFQLPLDPKTTTYEDTPQRELDPTISIMSLKENSSYTVSTILKVFSWGPLFPDVLN